MSEQTTTPRATDTIVPQAVKVTVGSGEDVTSYVIATFCLAKTIRTFAYMTELAEQAGLSSILSAAGASAEAGEFAEGGIAPGFISRALAVLPNAVRNGTPALYRLLGLIVTSNRKLREMDENGEDIDDYLLKIGRGIAYDGTNEQAVALVLSAVKVIGVDTILAQLPNLTRLLPSGRQS